MKCLGKTQIIDLCPVFKTRWCPKKLVCIQSLLYRTRGWRRSRSKRLARRPERKVTFNKSLLQRHQLLLTRAEADHHHIHHHHHHHQHRPHHHQQHHHQGGGWSEQGGSQSHFLSRLWLLLWAGDYHHPNVAMVAGSAPWRKTFVRGYFRGWSCLFLSFKFFKEAKITLEKCFNSIWQSIWWGGQGAQRAFSQLLPQIPQYPAKEVLNKT